MTQQASTASALNGARTASLKIAEATNGNGGNATYYQLPIAFGCSDPSCPSGSPAGISYFTNSGVGTPSPTTVTFVPVASSIGLYGISVYAVLGDSSDYVITGGCTSSSTSCPITVRLNPTKPGKRSVLIYVVDSTPGGAASGTHTQTG